MKATKKKIVALMTVAVMAAALLMSAVSLMPKPAFAETTADFATPAGYNDNDYQKLVVFMETVNSSGVKNGEAINPGVYTPEDPATWLYSVEYPWGTTSYGAYWEEIDGEMHFVALDNGFSCRLEGNIDFSECEYLGSVFLSGCDIPSANFSFCLGLNAIHIAYANLESINVSCCYNMVQFDAFGNNLNSDGIVGLADCGAIEVLNVSDNPEIEDLDISAFDLQLRILNVNNTGIGDDDIDFTRLRSVNEINITGTNITRVDMRNSECITALTCRDMPLEYLMLPTCDSNLQLDCANTGITELDVTGCTGLYQLNCSNNPIRELDFTNCPWMQFVIVNDCELETLNLAGCDKLIAVECMNNNLTEIDVSAACELAQFYCTGNMLTNIFWHVNNEWDGEYIVSLESEGNGYVAVGFEVDPETWGAINFFEAVPQEGYRFVNWVDNDGNEISTDPRYEYEPRNAYEMIAVFVPDGSEPVVTEEPTEPIVTDEPTEPVVTDEPTEPITPDVPATGAVSLSVLGVAAILAGGIAVSKRKH